MAKRRGMRRGVQRVDLEWYGDEFLDLVQEYTDEALFAAGEIVEREAKQRAPRASGRLAQSSYVATRSRSTYKRRRYWRKEKKAPPAGAVIGFTAPHAHLMESGRRKRGIIRPGRKRALNINGSIRATSRFNRMSSRPFLGPGLEASRDRMVVELAAVLRRRVDEKGRK